MKCFESGKLFSLTGHQLQVRAACWCLFFDRYSFDRSWWTDKQRIKIKQIEYVQDKRPFSHASYRVCTFTLFHACLRECESQGMSLLSHVTWDVFRVKIRNPMGQISRKFNRITTSKKRFYILQNQPTSLDIEKSLPYFRTYVFMV